MTDNPQTEADNTETTQVLAANMSAACIIELLVKRLRQHPGDIQVALSACFFAMEYIKTQGLPEKGVHYQELCKFTDNLLAKHQNGKKNDS